MTSNPASTKGSEVPVVISPSLPEVPVASSASQTPEIAAGMEGMSLVDTPQATPSTKAQDGKFQRPAQGTSLFMELFYRISKCLRINTDSFR